MISKIYCTKSAQGINSFFVQQGSKSYFLFNQRYRKSVANYFENGVCLNDTMHFGKICNNVAIAHTMEKLPAYIRYVEKEYELSIYNKKQKASSKSRYKHSRTDNIKNEQFSFSDIY